MSGHVVILGAGISGLATAWFLKQSVGSQVQLSIIEKSSRPGGWIQTIQTGHFLFEQGARSCRTKGTGQETLALVEALGLQNQVLIPHPDARHRYLYNTSGLRRLPRHLWEVPFHSQTRGWMGACWRDWSRPKCEEKDESIQAFFSRRLGSSWTERLVDPFVSGIYAGDCGRLSLKSCFPLFHQWETQYRSLIRGAWHHQTVEAFQSPFVQSIRRHPLFSFQQGMETLPRTLAQHLKDHLLLNCSITGLTFHADKIEVQLADHQRIKADYVISTLPTFALSSLLASFDPQLAAKLNQLSYATVWIVNIGFDVSVLPFKGFGYLVPSNMKSLVLGCVWDSSLFPQQNLTPHQTRLTVMIGGRHHLQSEHMSEQEVIECALQALHQQMGIRTDPSIVHIKKAQDAIPQYEVGYSIWKQELQEAFHLLSPRLILSGSAWTGVSINDCIAQALLNVSLTL